MMKSTQRVLAGIGALMAAATVGGAGMAPAYATPPPPAPPQCDARGPGDTPDQPGVSDTDNVQDGDQGGPEVPDGPC
ncbi:MAG: hypothetical protein HZB45_24800 [Mycolicibacterium rufum]|uniref:Intersectin-EH binding protein Ibp1 n=1 Tax=Mycolicibacterium chlorophenolicum TaxID=37916 RepID=A0A0J6VKI7_9MYCO|nr:hypothetical protein [Mycolicibacterium chlorophenolicum]KMO70779.1 hypothetical protein MCHLDSM_05672 [Mycolicibacterium chlorophenolicum]MBI5340913.1 hypothetical protein [Mycolicibacterium rufum]